MFVHSSSSIIHPVSRYGDGEAGIIQNTAINAKQDSWSIPSGPSKISEHLLQTLKGHMDEPFYYGFASVDSISSLNYFLGITEQNTNYITYANLFVNSNYKITLKILNKVMAGNAGDVVILANKEGKENAWLKFKNLKRFVECPDEGPLSYEKNHLNLLDQWEELARNHTQTLFIMSCGPLAKVAVSLMWAVNKHNR